MAPTNNNMNRYKYKMCNFIGNCKENNGVPSDASVGEMHDELCTRLQRASERMVAVATAARS